MTNPVPMAEIWRGSFLESVHRGHAVVCDGTGEIVAAWGDPDKVILPRSAVKMIQALPLIESGAAAAFGLGDAQLALSCASHQGAPIHTERVQAWLAGLGMSDHDLRCGPQDPSDRDTAEAMIRDRAQPCQYHNNCSGKHTGFLTLSKHLGAGPDYIDPAHPVQVAVRAAYEEVTGMVSPGHAIDGCSAPNFATSLHGMARAMAYFATARTGQGARQEAAVRLRNAMMSFPELVAGEGRACTELMRAMPGRVALKTGAEGVFAAILPEAGLGVALKIEDGATRGSECAVAAILTRLGVLDPAHPAAIARMRPAILNRRGVVTGDIRPAAALS